MRNRAMMAALVLAGGVSVTGCSATVGGFGAPEYDVTANSTNEVSKAYSTINEGYTESYVSVETEARENDALRRIVDELQGEYESADVLGVDFYEVNAQADEYAFKTATAHNTDLGMRAASVDFGEDSDTVIEEVEASVAPPPTEQQEAAPAVPTVGLGEELETTNGWTFTVEGVEELDQAEADALVPDDSFVSVDPPPYALVTLTATNNTGEYLAAPYVELRTTETSTTNTLVDYGVEGSDFENHEFAPGSSYSGTLLFTGASGSPVELAVGIGGEPYGVVTVE